MELELIHKKIYEIRGHRVMLDYDLAELYETETKRLNESVKRNIKRFPDKFMFKLTHNEWEIMRSQFATASEISKRNTRALPYAFTEHGVTMLASVLKNDKAIFVNIAIVEAFISLKDFASYYKELSSRLEIIEQQFNQKFDDVSEVINYLLKNDTKEKQQQSRNKIGYKKPE